MPSRPDPFLLPSTQTLVRAIVLLNIRASGLGGGSAHSSDNLESSTLSFAVGHKHLLPRGFDYS